MKNIQAVKEIIEQLKADAENEFELHRIEVLERDLIQGLPKVKIIDAFHQDFNGITYQVSKSGHYSRGGSLHQDVWRYYRGEIPQGDFQIHHINWNPADNSIENLQCLTRAEHIRIHANAPPLEVAPNKVATFTCEHCGKVFNAIASKKVRRFCSRACQRHAQLNSAKTESKTCLFCGKTFLGKAGSKYCSQKCRSDHAKAKVPIKTCPQCGKQFRKAGCPQAIYCSLKCRDAARQPNSAALTNQPTVRIVTCSNCGKEFTTLHPLKKYCSKECAAETVKKQTHTYEKTCPICGKKFLGTKKQKHCSTECRDQARRGRATWAEKHCQICGKDFKSRDKRVKYCSRECYQVSKRMAEHKPPAKKYSKVCPQCGETFMATDGRTKYCSQKCYHAATRTLPDRICPTCGKSFHPSGKNRIFCSRTCIRSRKPSARSEITKTCPICKKEFKARGKRNIYCSAECRKSAPHRRPVRQCPICGKKFLPYRSNQKYCSQQCAFSPLKSQVGLPKSSGGGLER